MTQYDVMGWESGEEWAARQAEEERLRSEEEDRRRQEEERQRQEAEAWSAQQAAQQFAEQAAAYQAQQFANLPADDMDWGQVPSYDSPAESYGEQEPDWGQVDNALPTFESQPDYGSSMAEQYGTQEPDWGQVEQPSLEMPTYESPAESYGEQTPDWMATDNALPEQPDYPFGPLAEWGNEPDLSGERSRRDELRRQGYDPDTEQPLDPNLREQMSGNPFTESWAPQSWRDKLGDIPIFGDPLEDVATGLTSPVGLASTMMFGPEAAFAGTAGSVLGGVAGSEIGRRLGHEELGRNIGELAGGFLGGTNVDDYTKGLSRAGGLADDALRATDDAIGITAFRQSAEDILKQADIEIRPPKVADDVAETVGDVRGSTMGFGPGATATDIEDPAARLTTLLKTAKPAREEAELLRSQELSRRSGKLSGIQSEMGGEAGFKKGMGALAGEQPTADFTPLTSYFAQQEKDELVNRAFRRGDLLPLTKQNAAKALLNVMSGHLPTRSEISLLSDVYGQDLGKELMKRRPLGTKAWENFVDVLNLPRQALTTLDHSFPGRQGLRLLPSHPLAWTTSATRGLEAMVRPKVAEGLDMAMRNDDTLIKMGGKELPLSQVKEAAGLFHGALPGMDRFLEPSAREEAFVSTWMNKLPIVGQANRASQRAYVTAGNKIRHDVFKRLVLTASDGNPNGVSLDTAKGLAQLVNEATGRGTLKFGSFLDLSGAAPALSGAMFAPRYRLSGVQWTAQLFNANPTVRKEAWKQAVGYYAAGATVLALIKVSGLGTVELDPRSSDFGKIRVGSQRIDFWGGLQPLVRTIAQTATGERKTSTGSIVKINQRDLTDNPAARYIRSGLSPQASIITDVLSGKSMVGDEYPAEMGTVKRELWNRMVPLGAHDMVEAIQNEGMRGGLISSMGLFGIGTQSYITDAEKRAKAYKDATGREFGGSGGDYAVIKGNPDLAQYAPPTENQERLDQVRASEEQKLHLPDIAARILSGDSSASDAWKDGWERMQTEMAGIYAEQRFGKEYATIKTPEALAYKAWSDIRPDAYFEQGSLSVNWDAYYAAKDAAFAKMPGDMQTALTGQIRSQDPAVQKVEALYEKARDVRSDLYDMGKYQGLGPQETKAVDDFAREVSETREQMAWQTGRTLTERQVAQAVAADSGQQWLYQYWDVLQSNRNALINPQYDAVLKANRGLLEPFYPEYYSVSFGQRTGDIAPTTSGSGGSSSGLGSSSPGSRRP